MALFDNRKILLAVLVFNLQVALAQTISFNDRLRVEALIQKVWTENSYEKKSALIKEAIGIDSTNIRLIGIRAYIKQAAGYKREAMVDYNRYMEAKPHSTFGLYRASCKAELGDTAGAWRELDKLIELAGNDYHISERLDDVYKKLGDMRRVEKYYTHLLKLRPNNMTAITMLALIKSEQGNHAGAIEDWETALKIVDNELVANRFKYRWIYWRKADSEFSLKRYDNAIESESQALLLYPDEKILYKSRINMYLAKGDQEKACTDYKILLKLQKTPFTSSYGTLNCAASGKNYEPAADWKLKQKAEQNYMDGIQNMKSDSATNAKAITFFTNTLRLQPDNLFALTCRAQCYSLREKNKEELEDLHKALKLRPGSAHLLHSLANAHFYSNQLDSAQLYLERAIATAPLALEYGFTKALILNKKKKYPEAIEEYNLIIQKNPLNNSAYYSKSYVEMASVKDYTAALRAINKAIEIMEDSPIEYQYGSYYQLKARIYDRLGEYHKALEANAQAIAVDPENAEYYFMRGELKARLKDMPGACLEWKKAQSLGDRSRIAEVMFYNCGG